MRAGCQAVLDVRVPAAFGTLLVSCLALLCFTAPARGQVNLSGNVRCEDGTIPEMITLYAMSVYGSDVSVRHTDADGNYTFALPDGTWVVQADPHYATWWAPNVHKYAMYRAEYFNNQFFYADATPLIIAPGVVHSNVNFVLERYTELAGRVVNAADGQPLANIPVGASVEDGTGIGSGLLQTATDAGGNYTLYVNVGQWSVYAAPVGLGFAIQYWSNKTDIASADLIHVSALGEPAHSNVNFSLQPVVYGKLSGFVYRPDGSPAQGAYVYASGSGNYIDPVWVNSTGYWEMATLLPDTYRLSASLDPYPEQYYCNQYQPDNAHRIALAAGADIQNVDFHLIAPARISGAVRNQGGAGISSAHVGLTSADGGEGYANTLGDGSYTIERLPPGHYRLYASATGYVQNWYSNQASQATAQQVVLEAEQTVSNIDFAMEAGGTIAGVVSNGTFGGEANSVQVLVTPAEIDQTAPNQPESYSDYSGSAGFGLFRVTGLRRGPYVLRTMSSEFQQLAGAFYDRKLAYEAADIVDLTTTDLVENITLFAYNEARITGKVTASGSGAGLDYATVYVLTTNGYRVKNVEANASGNYTCRSLAPGTYIVLASPMFHNEEYGTNYRARYYGGSTLASATRITLTDGMTQSGVDIALSTASGGISGKVTRAADGVAVTQHYLYVWSTETPIVQLGSATTDASGNYTVRGLAAGTYRAHTWPNSFGALQFYNGKTNYASADNITVGSSIVGGINFALNEVVPAPYAPAMRKPLPPVWQTPDLFEWSSIEGARFYELRVDDLTAGVTAWLQQAGIADTNFSAAAGFTPGHSYRAQTRAGNGAGYGEFGPPLTFTFLSPPLYALSVAVSGPGSVALDPPGGSYESGTVVALTAVEQDGSTFDHWSNVDSGAGLRSAVVTVTAARAVAAYFVANRPPQTPVPVAPTGGVISLEIASLETDPFQDPDLGDTFGASHFVVYQVEGAPLAQSNTNAPPETTFALAGTALQGNSSYHWKARFADGHGLWSDWSASVSFSTSNRPPSAPLCVAPAGGDGVSLSPLLRASIFSDPDTMDTHALTRWEIAGADGNFGFPVYNAETAGAASHRVPPGPLTYTNYFWRVRYKDSHEGWSGWSAPAAFDAVLTVDSIQIPAGGLATISWPTQTGFLYSLYSATGLVGSAWTPVPGQTDRPGTGSLMTYTETSSGTTNLYYCVTIIPATP